MRKGWRGMNTFAAVFVVPPRIHSAMTPLPGGIISRHVCDEHGCPYADYFLPVFDQLCWCALLLCFGWISNCVCAPARWISRTKARRLCRSPLTKATQRWWRPCCRPTAPSRSKMKTETQLYTTLPSGEGAFMFLCCTQLMKCFD